MYVYRRCYEQGHLYGPNLGQGGAYRPELDVHKVGIAIGLEVFKSRLSLWVARLYRLSRCTSSN